LGRAYSTNVYTTDTREFTSEGGRPLGQVAVDVRLGRFAFNPADPAAPAPVDIVRASYYTGLEERSAGGGHLRDLSLPLDPGEVADIQDVTQTEARRSTPLSWRLPHRRPAFGSSESG
jgi:hypothetical protein